MPEVLAQESGTAEAERRQVSLGPRVEMGDPPLMVAPDERLTHPIEDLRRVSR